MESAKPKGFPTTGSKRLQPIRATALKNGEMIAASPSLNSDNNTLDTKKNENMMRMTQPSSNDSAANFTGGDDHNNSNSGYHSMTNFGAKR